MASIGGQLRGAQSELQECRRELEWNRETIRRWWFGQQLMSCGCHHGAEKLLRERAPWLFEEQDR